MLGRKMRRRYAERWGLSSNGLQCGSEGVEDVGKGGLLLRGQRCEPESAPGHELRVAAKLALPPHHGAPDHLGGEQQRPEGRREFQATGRRGVEDGDVFDLGASLAKVEETCYPAVV